MPGLQNPLQRRCRPYLLRFTNLGVTEFRKRWGERELKKHVIPIHDDTHTDMMEQLQESYVGAVASTAAVSVQPVKRDNFKYDLEFVRMLDPSMEEASFKAQLKASTKVKYTHGGASVSYQFDDKAAFEDLAKFRKTTKRILILMVVHLDQSRWTYAHQRAMLVRHSCYWLNMEGMSSTAAYPTVSVPTANIFNAAALTAMMDRLDNGGTI